MYYFSFFAMGIVDEVSSEYEFVSENEVMTNDKGKKKQKKKTSNPKKDKKPPRTPSTSESPSIHVSKENLFGGVTFKIQAFRILQSVYIVNVGSVVQLFMVLPL